MLFYTSTGGIILTKGNLDDSYKIIKPESASKLQSTTETINGLRSSDSTTGSFIKLLYTLSQAATATKVPTTLSDGD